MLGDKFIDDKPSQNEVIQKKYPRTAILIALNQLCERFSYYGIRTILFLYLTSKN
jgi:dipeptide/tripeptide permease